MLLKDIKTPNDLKKMNIDELENLCSEIRSYLIETVSKTGGHLSSNLGVVELTVALHYCFNSPYDKIFFDVGHQCYTHKLLTGRYESFKKLRSFDGISGFQKRNESEHDVWEAGHSSTSLSAALGMAVARDLNHLNYEVIPVIGDGALTGGEAMEALNQIGDSNHKVIIIFNDNDMSISKNVGAINNIFESLRTSKSYTVSKKVIKDTLNKSGIGDPIISSIHNIKEGIKKTITKNTLFSEFGIEYYGPIDGHNIEELISYFELVKSIDKPVVLHVLTTKGKDYPLCEYDKVGYWHGVGSFDPQTGEPLNVLPNEHLSWSSIISETLIKLAKENKDICAITPAMITGSKLEKFFALYPNRSFDCGIAEQHATTFAAGLAISNKKPFISLYSTFLQRSYDQINHDICRMDLPVVIGIDRAELDGEDGDTHHGVFDIGLLRPLPNIVLSQPKDAIEAQNLLYTAFNQKHPFAIRYPKSSIQYEEVEKFENIEIGKWTVLKNSEDIKAYVITYGPEVDRIYQKSIINDTKIAVINARFFKPLDEELLLYIAKENKPVFTYEIDMLAGGLSSSILEFYNSKNISINLIRYGIKDQYVTFGSNNDLKKSLNLDINYVFKMIEDYINNEIR